MKAHLCFGCMNKSERMVCEKCGWSVDKNNEAHQLPVGSKLRNQYLVGRVLGQGGFGITYLGWDEYLELPVAIKEYYPNALVTRECTVSSTVRCRSQEVERYFNSGKERFLREGKALAKFRELHEVVDVHSFFEENGTAYIIMEYVKGTNLANYVQFHGGKLSVEETFRILRPVMMALVEIHEAGIVHRDISPDNIMLHPKGGAKLLDFGAARPVESDDTEQLLLHSTEAILKHGFAPLEQYKSRGGLGPWTDEYAICATIMYCLTGKIPPEAPARALGEKEVDFEVSELSIRQRKAIEVGMSIRAKDRYGSIKKLADALFSEVSNNTDDSVLPRTEQDGVHTENISLGHNSAPDCSREKATLQNTRTKWWISIGCILLVVLGGILLRPNGWVVKDGHYLYYSNGRKSINTWYHDGEKIYYFDDNGFAQTGFQIIDGNTYFFDTSGIMQIGWQLIDGKLYYLDEQGVMLTGVQVIDGLEYYFESKGSMCVGFQQINGEVFYFSEVGIMQKLWQTIENETYFFGTDGIMVTGFSKIGGNTYYFDHEGVMQIGLRNIDGDMYYFAEDGIMQKYLQKVDGTTYYFSYEGKMQKGFVTYGGKKYYFDDTGAMVNNECREIAGYVYYFDRQGIMQTGWQVNCGDSYEELVMRTSKQNEHIYHTYYFFEDGRMAVGACVIDGRTYNFDKEGRLQ